MLRSFLGKRVFKLLVLSVLTGVCLSAVEVGLSILLQSFLFTVGVLDLKAVHLPAWAPLTFRQSALWLMGFAVVRAMIQWFKIYGNSIVNEAFIYHMKLIVADWALTSKEGNAARVMTFLTDRVTAAAGWVTALQNAFVHGFSLLLLLLYLFKAAPLLAAGGLSILVAAGLLLRLLDRFIRLAGGQLALASSEINERLLDALRNLHFLRICRAERRELQSIRSSLRAFFESNRLFFTVKASKFAAPQLIGVLVVVLIAACNRRGLALDGEMLRGGAFVSFIYLFIRTSQTTADLSSTYAGFRMYRAQFLDLFEWWRDTGRFAAVSQEASDPEKSGAKPSEPLGWDLRDIDFSYGDRLIFNRLSLKIAPGAVVAFTGPSGIGKSTLLDLLAGISKPTRGQLQSTDGKARFGYVGPDPHLIRGTVRDNLMYGLDFQPSEEEMTKVLRFAHCGEFLTQLPADLDRKLFDRGDGLSAGQKQRLSLARAILRRPAALLLDEPTANLDDVSESVVVEALRELKGAMTIVLVTHRKALLAIVDQVVEL